MSVTEANPLLYSGPSSDGLHAQLHPMVLLTISDYITRHKLRRQRGPVVGGLLGQQNGRDISLEHAFECALREEVQEDGEQRAWVLNELWFAERLQQFRDVHKDPALDLVGWFTTSPESGPTPPLLPIHRQILSTHNESALLLTFHPTAISSDGSTNTGGKLPLTIYETVLDSDVAQVAGQEKAGKVERESSLKFRELPYAIETGEAEMISVDFVAKGGGNATAVGDTAVTSPKVQQTSSMESAIGRASRGKGKPAAAEEALTRYGGAGADTVVLSKEDEELVASLTARANAIKMLHSRIQLLRAYLAALPPEYLKEAGVSPNDVDSDSGQQVPVNHTILRAVQALMNRLPLLIPSSSDINGRHSSFATETLAEKNDVSLVSLLAGLTKSLKDVREVGKKFGVVEKERARENSGTSGPSGGPKRLSGAPAGFWRHEGLMGD